MSGIVTLVGAGPGDPGLLTLDGKRAIMNAEVLVFDRLVSEEIIALSMSNTVMVDVGKQSGHHPVPQDEINALLITYALSGARVVRLKGGDGYLFGRGGEEAQALHDAGIPFRIVPGVTSALAAPAYAGIPVTHRDFASSVHIITAKGKRGSEHSLDFKTLARLQGTLVFMMGIGALPKIVEGLQDAGIDGAIPAAVIENGTTTAQRKVVATVSTLTDKAQARQIKSPAIIVVGAVCGLSDTLDWYEKLPLRGMRILVTRPASRASKLVEQLRLLGAQTIAMPCIQTTFKEHVQLPGNLHAFSWVVLTSPFGVQAMIMQLNMQKLDLRALAHCKFACIGDATARELKSYGIQADYIPEFFTSQALAEGLCEYITTGEHVLLLRAEQGAEILPTMLKKKGISFADIKTYETKWVMDSKVTEISEMLAAGKIDCITFTSASTVKSFVSQIARELYQGMRAICIGEITAQEARMHGFSCVTAEKATIDSMVACIRKEKNACMSNLDRED